MSDESPDTMSGSVDDAELARLRDELAELRGDAMALWQRLGDVLEILKRVGGYHSAEDQAKIRNARAVHAMFNDDGG